MPLCQQSYAAGYTNARRAALRADPFPQLRSAGHCNASLTQSVEYFVPSNLFPIPGTQNMLVCRGSKNILLRLKMYTLLDSISFKTALTEENLGNSCFSFP